MTESLRLWLCNELGHHVYGSYDLGPGDREYVLEELWAERGRHHDLIRRMRSLLVIAEDLLDDAGRTEVAGEIRELLHREVGA